MKVTWQDVLKVAQAKIEKKEKLNPLEFTVFMVATKREEGFHGINPIFSGFNEAYKNYFKKNGSEEVVADLKELATTGIVASGTKWPHTLYFPSELPDGGAKARGEGVSGKAASMLASVGAIVKPTVVLKKMEGKVMKKADVQTPSVLSKLLDKADKEVLETVDEKEFKEFLAWKASKK